MRKPTPKELHEERVRLWHQQRDSLAVRFFELLITSGHADVREPRRAALCAKHCAETILDVLSKPQEPTI